MGNMKRYFWVVYFILIFLTGETAAAEKVANVSSENKKVIVYYFHTTSRCPSCTKIEKWSYNALNHSFQKALKEGRLLWKSVNVDKPKNRHFVEEYSLYTKQLIIAEVKGQKQTKWKNLNKVWPLLRDQKKFYAYVTHEVKNYLDN